MLDDLHRVISREARDTKDSTVKFQARGNPEFVSLDDTRKES